MDISIFVFLVNIKLLVFIPFLTRLYQRFLRHFLHMLLSKFYHQHFSLVIDLKYRHFKFEQFCFLVTKFEQIMRKDLHMCLNVNQAIQALVS